MITNHIHIFDTALDTAHALAEIILAQVKEKNKKGFPFNIALSGGSTPKILFNILALEYGDKMPWHFIRLFWVDERCVPPISSESNFGIVYESLLKHISIPYANLFRIQGEVDPQSEANRYNAQLEKELPLKNRFPQFDLILLGLGEDGHTASIFPNDMSLLHSDLAVAVGVQPESGQKRITLTGGTINQAKQVVFMVTGEAKATILRQIIQKEPGSENFPATHVHSVYESVEFYLDKAAASQLNS